MFLIVTRTAALGLMFGALLRLLTRRSYGSVGGWIRRFPVLGRLGRSTGSGSRSTPSFGLLGRLALLALLGVGKVGLALFSDRLVALLRSAADGLLRSSHGAKMSGWSMPSAGSIE